MTKHTYYRAYDGTLFFPETAPMEIDGKMFPEVHFSTNNASASKACMEYEMNK